MCKIAIIPGINDKNRARCMKFLKRLTPKISEQNDDGFGYAAFDKNGNLFGERWLDNNHAFKSPNKKGQANPFIQYSDFLEKNILTNNTYSSFGEVKLDTVSTIIAHARFATCEVSMANTHPFYYEKDQTALIHNGVIHNHSELNKKTSTCDSEVILSGYVENKVSEDPTSIQEVVSKLRGYYACGVLSKVDGLPILDIFKNSTADLYAVFIVQLDTTVFSTSLSDLYKTCKELKYNILISSKVNSGKLLRLNAKTGQTLSVTDFNPLSTYYNDRANYPYANAYGDSFKGYGESGLHEYESSDVDPTNKNVSTCIANLDEVKEGFGWQELGPGLWRKI